MAIYVQRRVLSVRVGTQKTLIAEMDYKSKNPHVHRFMSFDTPDEAIEDGFILKPDVLAEAIKEELKEQKVAVKEVIFTVTSSKIANREVTLPIVPEAKLKKMIQTQATEYFPFDLSDYVLTHMTQNVDKKVKTQDLLLFAAPNDLIQSYYDLAKRMNSTVMFIDYDGNSSFQILRKQVRENRTAMAIQMNTNNCMINIMYGDKLMLQRSIPYGIAAVFDAMLGADVFNVKTSQAALALLEDQHVLHTRLNNDAVKNLKVNESMLAISDSYRRNLEYESARVDVTDAFGPMINNFIRVIDYYHSKHSDNEIKEIILTGMGAKIAGILDLFNNETGIEVRELDDIVGVSIAPSAKSAGYNPIEFISCIGATFQPIGFASLEITKKETSKTNAMNYVAVAVLVVVVAGIFVGWSFLEYNTVKDENQEIESRIKSLESVNEVFDAHTAAKRGFDVVSEAYLNSHSDNNQLNELLDAISNNMPKNMILQSIDVREGVVSLNIESERAIPPITLLLQQFETIPFVTDVTVLPISSVEDKVTGESNYGFSVQFRYKTQIEMVAEAVVDPAQESSGAATETQSQ